MNFLLIQADQQRRDFAGTYGSSLVRTPGIDRLAREGVVFDYAFTPCPICGPARASLVTGLRPGRHGILFNSESGSPAGRDFIGRHITLAERLAEVGCVSTLCGKWHVGTDLPPSACGFEGEYFPGYGNPEEHPHYRDYLRRLGASYELTDHVHARGPNGRPGWLLAAVQSGPVDASVPYYLAEQAIAAMRRGVRNGRPFFVRCDFWGPHIPFVVPRRYAEMYDPADLDPWPNFADDLSDKPRIQAVMRRYWGVQDFAWEDWSRLVAMCCGYVTLIDDQVRRMTDALAELGAADRTAVFFTSDHGGMVGAHGLADKGPYLYDEACRVPLIARVPHAPPGRRSDALVYNMDLMPTILDLADCPVPADLDAVSLRPLLDGSADRVRDDDAVFIEFHGHQVPYPQRLVRTRQAKYIFNGPDVDELYDLQTDPHELVNLAERPDGAALLGPLRDLLRRHLRATNDPILRFFDATRHPTRP